MSVLGSSGKALSPFTSECNRDRFSFNFDSSNIIMSSLRVVPRNTPDDKLFNEIKLTIPESDLKADLSSCSVGSSSSRECISRLVLPKHSREQTLKFESPSKRNHNKSYAFSPEKALYFPKFQKRRCDLSVDYTLKDQSLESSSSPQRPIQSDWYLDSKLSFINDKIMEKLNSQIFDCRIHKNLEKIVEMLSTQKVPTIKLNGVSRCRELKPIERYLKLLRTYCTTSDILGKSEIMKQLSYLETLMIVPKKKYLIPSNVSTNFAKHISKNTMDSNFQMKKAIKKKCQTNMTQTLWNPRYIDHSSSIFN